MNKIREKETEEISADSVGNSNSTKSEQNDQELVGSSEETESTTLEPQPAVVEGAPWGLVWGLSGLLIVLGAAAAFMGWYIHRLRSHPKNPEYTVDVDPQYPEQPAEEQTEMYPQGKQPDIGKVHNIGKRKSQQDSLAVTHSEECIFATVADGMGGLANGDQVSQKAVLTMLQNLNATPSAKISNPLFALAAKANAEVNQFLGKEFQYKSGTTLLAVMMKQDGFHWLAIGDSRIYLYRAGGLVQLNEEHIFQRELLKDAANGETSLADAATNPQNDRLTNFVGMGRLKMLSGSLHPVKLVPGDRVLLMSDGVFNTVSEEEIVQILSAANTSKDAAILLENCVLKHNNPKQDNFTTVILGWK